MAGTALFGGSFDPPHATHRRIAKDAHRQLGCDRLVVLPCRRHAFKDSERVAPAEHRLAMCKLNFADLSGVEVSDRELRRAGPSYTVDTLRAFRDEVGPAHQLFWVVGSDNLPTITAWHRYREIFKLCTLVTLPRAGSEPDAETLARSGLSPREVELVLQGCLDGEPDDVSASDVRARLARGDAVPELLPAVAAYIAEHDLYATA